MKLDAETSQKRVIALAQLQKLKLRQLELKKSELEKFIQQSEEKLISYRGALIFNKRFFADMNICRKKVQPLI